MVSVSFTISDDLKTKMEKFSWINWSEVAREEAIKQDKRAELFKELEELTKDSAFTEKDALELGRKINKSLHKRYKEMFKGG